MRNIFLAVLIALALCNPVMAGPRASVSVSSSSSSSSSSYVTNRAPASTDDSASGYGVNQFWSYNGNFWYSTNVGVGTANWQIQSQISAAICDEVPTCLGAYGVFKLVAAYVGPAFQVTRASDSTTLDIGFTVLGIADWVAVDKFCLATTCGVSIWYDMSGNAYNLVQATQANMPKIYGSIVGGLRSITFDGINGNRNMKNTAMPFTDRRAFTALFIGRANDNGTSSGNTFFEIGNPTNKFTFFCDPNGNVGLKGNGGSSLSFSTGVRASDQIMVVTSTAGVVTATQNNQSFTMSGGAISSSAATGLQIGATVLVGYPGRYEALAFVFYDSTLSSINSNNLQKVAYKSAAISPQTSNTLTIIGDSISCCTTTSGATLDSLYVQQMLKQIKKPVALYNWGVPSKSLATMVSEAATIQPLSKITGARNVALIFGGTNDIAIDGQTAAQVYANMQTISASYRAAGYLVAIATPLPRNAGGFETTRQSLITLMRAGYGSFADALCDVGSDPVIGAAAAATDITLFPDGIHPSSPLGSSYIAASFAKCLNQVM